MLIATAVITLHAPWVHTLKEKRSELKSLVAKIQNRYNVSAAEVGAWDVHQTMQIGIAGVATDTAQADSILDHIFAFIESNTEAEVVSLEREIR